MFLPNLKLIVHVIQSIFEIINRILYGHGNNFSMINEILIWVYICLRDIIMRINKYKYFFKTTFYLSLYEREHVLDNVSNKISF